MQYRTARGAVNRPERQDGESEGEGRVYGDDPRERSVYADKSDDKKHIGTNCEKTRLKNVAEKTESDSHETSEQKRPSAATGCNGSHSYHR